MPCPHAVQHPPLDARTGRVPTRAAELTGARRFTGSKVRAVWGIVLASLALAVASLAVAAPAPSYDPWAWLLWGREVTELKLSTPTGPAFKPLPVAVCTLLAPLGDAAPWLWVLIARTAAAGAVLLSFRLGRRLGDGSLAGGLLAAAAVVVTGRFAGYAASGVAEGMLLCFALAGLESHRSGRPRAAIACGVACALLRVETWPLLLLAALLAWRRAPAFGPPLAGLAVLVPAAWFLPELLGSGDLLRSGARARIPNPGQPALAPVPALASLSEALKLVPWPLWLGIGALVVRTSGRVRRSAGAAAAAPVPSAVGVAHVARTAAAPHGDLVPRAVDHPLTPAAVGLCWIAIVAAMAQLGFSGEARYALPGAALIGISGAAGLAILTVARPGRVPATALVIVALVLMVGPRSSELAGIPAAQAHQWRLARDLERAVAGAGGRQRVLACGTPYVGRLRGPLMAYALDVEKSRVEPDHPPRAPGVVFRSRLTPDSALAPEPPASFESVARVGAWEVLAACRSQRSRAGSASPRHAIVHPRAVRPQQPSRTKEHPVAEQRLRPTGAGDEPRAPCHRLRRQRDAPGSQPALPS